MEIRMDLGGGVLMATLNIEIVEFKLANHWSPIR
jgi:hypothetical protein